MSLTLLPGRPYPLGATITTNGTNSAIFSEAATRSTLVYSTNSVLSILKRLGIAAVELLPTHHFIDEGHRVDEGLRDY
jgi:pullulanase/glycogen debranching enzyme